jgi:hypothetical protein
VNGFPGSWTFRLVRNGRSLVNRATSSCALPDQATDENEHKQATQTSATNNAPEVHDNHAGTSTAKFNISIVPTSPTTINNLEEVWAGLSPRSIQC